MADSEGNYDLFLSKAIEVAKVAGETIRSAFQEPRGTFETKDGNAGIDLVTKTDQQVEGYIFETLKRFFPTHKFVGEESHTGGFTAETFTDEPTWIIDPIDGTTNFVHRYPFLCVSIALMVNREIVVGVVYNPILEELYRAVKGAGAFMNGKPIHVAKARSLPEAVVATNVGYNRTPEGVEFMLGNLRGVLAAGVRSVRSQGTAACDLCSVALGRLDVFWEYGIKPWDIAAGSLMVQEAGGVVLDPMRSSHNSSHKLTFHSGRVLAGNSAICQAVIDVLEHNSVPEVWRKV